MRDSYESTWLELRKSGAKLLEKSSRAFDVGDPETVMKDVWHDIITKADFFSDEYGDHCYYSSKAYAYEHFEELRGKYSPEEIEWMSSWHTLLRVITESDYVLGKEISLSRVPKAELPALPDLLLYVGIRGPIPERFPTDCSYAIVIESLESAARADKREKKAKVLSDYVKRHPELKEELANGRSIPKSYASELAPLGILVSDLATYYNNSRRVPSLCGIHARRLLREYIEKFGELPCDEDGCLSKLGVIVVDELRSNMTRLKGTLRREINSRRAKAYLREHKDELRQVPA